MKILSKIFVGFFLYFL